MTKNNGGFSTNLAQLLMRAFYWVDEGLQNTIRAKGWPEISRAQSMIFVNIGEGVTRSSEIASRLGVTRQAVHQTINELVLMGLVELKPDPKDKRAKKVELTEKGLVLARDALVALEACEKVLARRLGEEQVKKMREALSEDWGDTVKPEDTESVDASSM